MKHLGYDAGAVDGKDGHKTRDAIAAFQTKHGLPADGSAGESTRAALFKAYMDGHNTLALQKKDFDDINGAPTAGCCDFNRVEKTEGDCGVNRRVAVLLVKSTKKIPLNYPCQKESVVPCKAQAAKKGARRTAGFGCHFYDKLVQEVPMRGPAPDVKNMIIELSVFFDGTNNNRDSHRPLGYDSNVSKLFDLFDHDDKTRYAIYVEGVGSGSAIKSDPITGGFSGRGINERIERASAYVKSITDKHPGMEIRLSVFGFSRGAATALAFINQIFDPAPNPRNQTLSGAMGSHPNEKPTGPLNTPAADSPKLPFEKIWFAGLFDVVGSIGLPGDAEEFIHDLTVRPSRISRLTHLISRDERRALFPLTSIRSGPNAPLPPGWSETPFPGVHSDVGGGYENMVHEKPLPSPDGGQDHTQVAASLKTDRRDYLSRVAGWAMFDAAKAAGLTMHSFKTKDAAPHSPEDTLKNIISGPGSPAESPENGWTTFNKPDTKEPRIKEALELLSIPPSLLPLWSARHSETELQQMMNFNHPDYVDHIAPYMHDSMGLKDPKGIGAKVGMNISPRTILYRGGT